MPIPSRVAISFSAPATSSACARLSSWHGPAMIEIGRSLPNLTGPTETTGLAETFAFTGYVLFQARTMPVRATRINPNQSLNIRVARGYFTDENAVGTNN